MPLNSRHNVSAMEKQNIAGGLAVDPSLIRRGELFLINIGVPVVVGVVSGQPRAALLGAVVGMLLAFADNARGLALRLRLLALDAGAIAAGALAGYYLAKSSAALLWPIFIAMTLGVGMAARVGREPLIAGRHCVMAFTVAAVAPSFDRHEIWYVAGTIVLNAASRALDHVLHGPLPLQRAAPLQMPAGHGGWMRFAVAFAGATTAALWIGETSDPVHTIWVVTTTIVVMQPDARASYRRIVERILGTFVGVAAAWAITTVSHSAVLITVAIVAIAPFIPHHLANRYWLHTALIALMILLAYDLTELNSQTINAVLVERMKDMLLGCAMALIGTAVAFPRSATEPDRIDYSSE
jgi:hypothetical protein